MRFAPEITVIPGGGGRVYGARLTDARVFARGGHGHGAWARISASGAAAYSRSASGEEDEVVHTPGSASRPSTHVPIA